MKLRLMYFAFPFWRAEASRVALFLGNVEFDNVHVGRDEFMAMKSSGELPYGQLPVLEVDGFRVGQAVAIAKFCGKVSGHYPSDDVEALRVDELLDAASDVTSLFAQSFREPDAEKKLAMRKALLDGKLTAFLAALEKRFQLNDGPYFVGNTLTIADIVWWAVVGWFTGGSLDGIPTTLVDSYPGLKSLHAHVDALDGVKAWRARTAG